MCLQIIFDKKLLSEDGVIVCEHATNFKFDKFEEFVYSSKKYGNTSVSYINF